MTIPHPTTAHFRLRSGLQSGLDCTVVENDNYSSYTCGATFCYIVKDSGRWGCKKNGNNPWVFGWDTVALLKHIAKDNGV